MLNLQTFELPLPSNGPPAGFSSLENIITASGTSRSSAFKTGIDQRDSFHGERRCIVCGNSLMVMLQHCHIIKQAEFYVWNELKDLGWLPPYAKNDVRHDPRNGMCLCGNCRICFDGYLYFICYVPQSHKFVLVNYSNTPYMQQFHGKAVALDPRDHHAVFSSLFILQEMRVRAHNPFRPTHVDIHEDPPWQDWLLTDSFLSNNPDRFFTRDAPARNVTRNQNATGALPLFLTTPDTSETNVPQGTTTLTLDADSIEEILAATRAMPSWRACQMEGIDWTGTAQENVEKYKTFIGVEDPEDP